MKKWNAIILMSLLFLSTSVLANNQTDVQNVREDKRTLAKRHPLLALSAAVALKQLFGYGPADGPFEQDFIDDGEFALEAVVPASIEDSAFLSGVTLLIMSPFISHPSGRPVHPLLFSTGLGHINNALKESSLPFISNYTANSRLASFDHTLKHIAPTLVEGGLFLSYYAVTGADFSGFSGAIAKGAGTKTIYVLMDGIEQFNIDVLTSCAGNQAWVQPVAQLETGVVLSISGYSFQAISATLSGFIKKVSEDGIAHMAPSWSNTLLGFAPESMLGAASSLSATLSNLASEVAGFEFASAIFSAVEKATPTYAPYINPALGASLIYFLRSAVSQSWLQLQPGYIQMMALGAALSGFIQVVSSVFSLPGWLDEVPSKAWAWIRA